MDILTLNNVKIAYGAKKVIHDVSLSLAPGEIVALVGESGSGKSTVLKAIIGLLGNDATVSGHIEFEGHPIVSLKESELSKLRGNRIAMIFQNPGAYFTPLKTIGQLYNDFLKAHGKSTDVTLQNNMLTRVGFDKPEHILVSYGSQLSGGMQQRIAIAMAMTLQPAVLLADEPTSALDAIYQEEILKVIKKLCVESGTAVLFVTHNLRAATYLADYIGIMKAGHLIEFNTTENIKNNPQERYTKILWEAIPDLV